MDVSSRVLNELASREQALDAQIEAARQDAAREIESAQGQAAGILKDAEAQARALSAEREQDINAESQVIRDEALSLSKEEVLTTHTRSEAKLGQAVETILRAVLP